VTIMKLKTGYKRVKLAYQTAALI